MRIWTNLTCGLFAACISTQGFAGEHLSSVIASAQPAQVLILGEVHDNPHHHLTQAAVLMALRPKAVVWEMLTEEQAARLTSDTLAKPADLAAILGWDASGWPEFSLYQPIFEATPQAQHYGAAVPREAARAAMETGIVAGFSGGAARFGLDQPLSPQEQAAREAEQLAAHCDAVPVEILPAMVDIQRLRDATLARVALAALAGTGGPVAVITGNGHARRDWGVPTYLQVAAPQVAVFSLGQMEAGQIEGSFDAVLDAPAVERPDPCAVFR